METGRNNLLEALRQVERRTENSASGWRLLLYVLIFLPIANLIPSFFGYWDNPALFWPGYSIVLTGLLLAFSLFFDARLREDVRKTLETSRIAQDIANGTLLEDEIFQRTPPPWRWMLPGSGSNPAIKEVIRRVAWNLDWYMGPKKYLFRAEWLYLLACIPPVILIAQDVYYGVLMLLTGQGLDIGSLWLIWLVPLPFIYYRRQIWTEELVRHLRERLQA